MRRHIAISPARETPADDPPGSQPSVPIVVWGMINEYWILRFEDLPGYAHDIVDAHTAGPDAGTIVMASGTEST